MLFRNLTVFSNKFHSSSLKFASSHLNPLSPLNHSAQQPVNIPRVLFKCIANNIHVNISNENGRTLSKLTAGSIGFKNTNKISQKSALAIVDEVKKRLENLGYTSIKLELNGFNPMRSLLIYQLRKCGIAISEIYDTTAVPFNGCRPKKTRRL